MLSMGTSLPSLTASSSRLGLGPSLPPLLPQPAPGRMPYPPHYAPPSIARSTATAQGQFSSSHRPPSFPSTVQQPPIIPHCGPQASGTMYGYAPSGHPGVPYPSSDYPNPMFPRRYVASQQYTNQTAGHYGAPPLQLPPMRPTPPGTNIDPATAQRQHHFQPQLEHYGQPASSRVPVSQPVEDSDERNSKRPRMDIRGILGPRE